MNGWYDLVKNVSIIIPHFQKQKHLTQVWEELSLQIHQDDQILIVDDHSPDGVPDLDCPCTEVIRPEKQTPHTYRLSTLRNLGLQNAKHDWCIILDPDCVPNVNFMKNARAMSDASVLFSGCIDKVQEDGSIKPDGRRNSNQSRWIDLKDEGGGSIWGGCMVFSKSRTGLVGWFDEDFDGAWGAEDAEFGSKCYQSGMRLRFSMELQVTHQYHPKDITGYPINKEKWVDKTEQHRNYLSTFTPYKPAVGVMVITMLRPNLINQCLQSIFRNRIPARVRLINNGDTGEDTRKTCNEWGRRWAVDYVNHERKWPAQVRNESMRWAKHNKFKYIVFIDDDVTVINNGVSKLVQAIENNPDIYAMSGKLRQTDQQTRLLGGPLRDHMFYRLTDRKGVHSSDWVGGGFTIHKVNPLLLYDDGYETGFNDYDWSMMAKRDGHKLAVCGDAEAWHAVMFTSKGLERHSNSVEYNQIRYDKERHARMRKRFEDKWGFYLEGGGLTDK